MASHFVDKANPDLGYYQVFKGVLGARWQWTETAKGVRYEETGDWCSTVAAAFRAAADDWESNGNSSNRRLAGQLRAAATRAEKEA